MLTTKIFEECFQYFTESGAALKAKWSFICYWQSVSNKVSGEIVKTWLFKLNQLIKKRATCDIDENLLGFIV